MKLLILYAFDNEVSILQQRLSPKEMRVANCTYYQSRINSVDVFLAKTGIGTTRASVITTRLSLALKPDIIFFIGTAGGLKPGLHTGDLFIGDKIIDIDLVHLPDVLKDTPYSPCLIEPHHDMPIKLVYQLDPTLLSHFMKLEFPKTFTGTIATSNTFPAPKEALAVMKSHDSTVIEMEGSGLSYAAFHDDTPLVVVRAVSNNLDSDGNDLGTPDDAIHQCAVRLADFMMVVMETTPDLQKNPALRIGAKAAESTRALIEAYELTPHPEGGFYKRVCQSSLLVSCPEELELTTLPDIGKKRLAVTSIYFLLTSDSFSAWHRLKSEEIWHYYKGSPLTIHTINNETHEIESVMLGNPLKHHGSVRQYLVKGGVWFCAVSEGHYSFVGATVAPGFDFADFEMGDRKSLLTLYPHLRVYIEKFTRDPHDLNISQTVTVFNPAPIEEGPSEPISHTNPTYSSSSSSTT